VLEKRPVSKIVISKLPKLYENNKKKLVRFFIPPLYTKFFNNKLWSKLWVQTYKAARNADFIIVIGCSLIATDYHLRAILSKAMSDKRKKYKGIILVDPSLRVQKSLKSFFRGRSEKGCKVYSSFTTFCRQGFNKKSS
jgi:NAD-dependent SIR2 family protein deacetylase